MKTHFNYLWIILLLPFFVGCDSNHSEGYSNYNYQTDIGTVVNPSLTPTFSILLDNNKLLKVTRTEDQTFIPKDGQRIVATYTLLSVTKVDTTYTRNILLNNAYSVLTKGILKITPATQDSIGHDSITIRDMWIGNDFLNIEFSYLGNNKTHYINLVSDASKVYTDGKVHLEFRHNANGDSPTYYSKGIVSFNLKSLQTGVTATVLNLLIHVNVPYQAAEKTYNVVYYFGPTTASYVAPDFNSLKQGVQKFN